MLDNPPLQNGGYLWVWWADVISPPVTGYTVDPFVASIYNIPVPPGEVQYTSGYDEEMTAVAGILVFQNTMSINSANKPADEDNIAADGLVTFIGGDGGRLTTTEDILIDGAGAQTVSENQLNGPFSEGINPFFPPFCDIVLSGSSVDISTGSISTKTGIKFISATADIPTTETYLIDVQGVMGSGGNTDAQGTVSAYMKGNVHEGIEEPIQREFPTDPLGFIPGESGTLSYSETSVASGSIHSFYKNMQYQSGISIV
jgi:hypothetical protein